MKVKSSWPLLASILTAVTILFLSNSIATASTVTVTEVVTVRQTAVEVVKKAKKRYKKAKKRRAKIIAKSFVKQSEINVGTLNFLVQNLRRGIKVKRKHLDACRGISRMITGGLIDLEMGRIDRAETVVIRVVALEVSLPTASNAVAVIREIEAGRGNKTQVVSNRDVLAINWRRDNGGVGWGWEEQYYSRCAGNSIVSVDGTVLRTCAADEECQQAAAGAFCRKSGRSKIVCEEEKDKKVCVWSTSPWVPTCRQKCRKYIGGKICSSNGTVISQEGWWTGW
jgi:hypothetical protein